MWLAPYFPAGQLLQVVRAVWCWNFPLGHLLQLDFPCDGWKNPLAQELQTDKLEPLYVRYCPAAQLWHDEAPDSEYFPLGHRPQPPLTPLEAW